MHVRPPASTQLIHLGAPVQDLLLGCPQTCHLKLPLMRLPRLLLRECLLGITDRLFVTADKTLHKQY